MRPEALLNLIFFVDRLDLHRFCAGHLSVSGSFKETDEMIKHTDAFKQETVRIAQTSGLPRGRVASESGIENSTLGKWLSQHSHSALEAASKANLAR